MGAIPDQKLPQYRSKINHHCGRCTTNW
jgi:hypothetical protein